MPTAEEMRQLGAEFLASHRARKADVVDLKADSAALVAELVQGTANRKGEVAGQLAEYATEMKEARDAWREHLGAPPPPVEAAPPPPPVKAAPPPPPVEKAAPDDLTAIRGIGASMEMRLSTLGITTFAQLAEASPGEIRARLGDFGRLADVEGWIAQARDLAK